MPIKITENVRSGALKRPLQPSIARDSEIPGLTLHVTGRRAFWALNYQPQGINPATGRRWGGGVRFELGDAFQMSVGEARAAALAAKALVRQGRSPHHEAMAFRASVVAQRSIVPTAVSAALDEYGKALMARRSPSEATRRQAVAYAGKAVRLMKAEAIALKSIDPAAVRLLVETAPGSAGERRHVFGGLNRFLSWCRRTKLIERNPCDDLERNERPKPGRARDNVPSLEEIRLVWQAIESEPQRDLVRFLLLAPLRRDEAAGLKWCEVDLDARRIVIGAERMKNSQPHELPLSPQALAILEVRKPGNAKPDRLVFPSSTGAPYDGWTRLTARIRKAIGQKDAPKAKAFTPHDVRRSFVSLLAGRFDIDLLDQCLSHTRKGVLGVYQRSARMGERVRAMNAWADLVTGEKKADNVVRLHAAS